MKLIKYILIVILGLLLVPGFTSSISKYDLLVAESEGPYLVQLEILPNGQIIDPNKQFYMGWDQQYMTLHPNGSLFYVSARTTLFTFRIDKNGDIHPVDTTYLPNIYTNRFAITPNGELMLLNGLLYGPQDIYSLDSNGRLTDTGNIGVNGYNFAVDPLGKIVIDNYSADTPAGNTIYQIDYANKQLIKTQVVSWTTAGNYGNNVSSMLFTPDGKMAVECGSMPTGYNKIDGLRVLNVDSTGSVSTGFRTYIGGNGMVMTPDGKYFYVSGYDTVTFLFQVDSTHTTLIDTDRRFLIPPGTEVWDYTMSPDGTYVVIKYFSPIGQKQMLTTAYVAPSGELYWTGYTFPFEETYGPYGTLLIIPIYTTDVPKKEWTLYE